MNAPKTHLLYYFLIRKDGKLVVSMAEDGTLEFGEGFTPIEAAVEFWKAVVACKPLIDM